MPCIRYALDMAGQGVFIVVDDGLDGLSQAGKGFSKKDGRFLKLKNISDLLCYQKEGKIMENIDFSYFSNLASFIGNPVEKQKSKYRSSLFNKPTAKYQFFQRYLFILFSTE